MAAVSAVVIPALHTGDVLVAPSDAYPGIRAIARDVLEPNGVEVRLVPTDDDAVRAALPGATLVWLESPSNPGLDVLDLPRARSPRPTPRAPIVAVDNTLAGPLRQRPLELGADYSVMSALQAPRRPQRPHHGRRRRGRRRARRRRCARGASPRARSRGRSRPGWRTARWPRWALRLERQEANARALADAAAAPATTSAACAGPASARSCASTSARRPAPTPSWTPASWWREATSFGGLHSNAERRARWGSDAVGEGFIRFNAGIEDAPDLVADVERALELSRP